MKFILKNRYVYMLSAIIFFLLIAGILIVKANNINLSHLSEWTNNLVLTYNGQNYNVTDQTTKDIGHLIGTVAYHDNGTAFHLYSINHVDNYEKIAVQTKKGYIVAVINTGSGNVKSNSSDNSISTGKIVSTGNQQISTDKLKDTYNDKEIYNDLMKEYGDIKVASTINFKGTSSDYALIKFQMNKDAKGEYQSDAYALVDLNNRSLNILNVWAQSEVLKIVDENEIYFSSNGKYFNDGVTIFPFICKFIRIKPSKDNQDDFISTKENRYLKVTEPVEYGSTAGDNIPDSLYDELVDVTSTFDGLQILFKRGIVLGSTTDPATKVHYSAGDKQLIFDVSNCRISKGYDRGAKQNVKNNPFVNAIELKENGNRCSITIDLKTENLDYTVENQILSDNNTEYPKDVVSFRQHEVSDDGNL